MKIALISPKGIFFENDEKYKKIWGNMSDATIYRNFHSGFGLGLLVVAALTPKSFKIKIIDENFEPIDFDEKFDLVGITGMTQQAIRAYEIADAFRKKKVKVVIGGIHATVLPEEAKEHADSVIIGEAEELWPEFLKDFSQGNIKPFYKTSHLTDLTKSPIPRYDLLNRKNYNVVWIQATRGCPIDCEFCAASKIYGLKFRHKTVEQVINEIKYAIKVCGRGTIITFADDNMFINRKYAVELVGKIALLKIRWFAQTDVSVEKDENFLKLLRKSKCSVLFIGFETLNKKGLLQLDRNSWKYRKFEDYETTIEKIQSYGIGVLGAFMLGLDTDTPDVFKELADFINRSHLLSAQITILTPLPGTRLRDRLEKEGRLLPTSWNNYSFLKANYLPRNMLPEELEEGLLKVYHWIYNEKTNIKRIRHFKRLYSNLLGKNT